MDFDMVLYGFISVEKDNDDDILLLRGEEMNGNTFTIRLKHKDEVEDLIENLKEKMLGIK